MTDALITFDDISKRYLIFGSAFSLKDIGRLMRRTQGDESAEIWALRNLSLEIKRGETVGIVGPNGAGKTTLLQLVSHIIHPTTGKVEVRGQVSALIHLGAGFHPDLTGRENIYINGAILGMSRKEITRRFDQIVAFSGLERYLDLPVKRYSSGMFARLGFSIAAHSNPDILIVDEVLAVGDAEFQARCLERMKELRDGDTTIIFVSHYLPAVQSLCKRSLYLDHGRLVTEGPTHLVLQEYQQRTQVAMLEANQRVNAAAPTAEHLPLEKIAEIREVRLASMNGDGLQTNEIQTGGSLQVQIRFALHAKIKNPVFSIHIERQDGVVCCATASNATLVTGDVEGEGSAEVTLPELALVPGVYVVGAWITDSDNIHAYDSTHHTLLKVTTDLPIDYRFGVFVPQAQWRVQPDGDST